MSIPTPVSRTDLPAPSAHVTSLGALPEISDYQRFMARELLIWLVGVPVPIVAVIGFFVL